MATLPTSVQRRILNQVLPMMSNEALIQQYEDWIRAGMGNSYWALIWVRREILDRMEPIREGIGESQPCLRS